MPSPTLDLPLIGRDRWVQGVIDRLRRPDDVRSNPRSFLQPGFYGPAGIGKTRLLSEIARRASDVTPYVVHIDCDPRGSSPVPGTPLALVHMLIDALETQDRVACGFVQRSTWGRSNPFRRCRELLQAWQPAAPVTQSFAQENSQASGVTQIQIVTPGAAVPENLAHALAGALAALHCKADVVQEWGRIGKPKPRPLVLLILDTVELAPRPVREWIPQVNAFFSAANGMAFHVVWVLAGRAAVPPALETALPPLSDPDATTLVQAYARQQAQAAPGKAQAGWQRIARDPALHARIVAAGDAIPLLLHLVAEEAALAPAAFLAAGETGAAPPAEHEARVRYATERYLSRLADQAAATHDDDLWQRYRLLLYAAVPRRVHGTGHLRVLLLDLPGTPFDARSNFDDLLAQWAAEAYVSRQADGSLLMHEAVREGVLASFKAGDPEQWARLHARAAAWCAAHGDAADHFYHALRADYPGTFTAWRAALATALAAGDWPQAQRLIETANDSELTTQDAAYLTLYKADLAWGEANHPRALARLRSLYAAETPAELRGAVAERLERWAGWRTEDAERLHELEDLDPPWTWEDLRQWASARSVPRLEARALRDLGYTSLLQGRSGEAADAYRQALALSEAIGDRRGQADARRGLGDVALMQDRYVEAADVYRQALALYEAIGDRRGQADARRGLGDAARLQGRYVEAADAFQQALALNEAVGDRRGQANARRGLGEVALVHGRNADAADAFRQALALYEAIGDWRGQAQARRGLGDVALMQDRYAEAAAAFRQALALFEAVGDRLRQAQVRRALGDVARLQDRYAEAMAAYRQALAFCEEIGDRLGQAGARRSLGDAALEQARYAEAADAYRQALALSEEIGDRLGQAGARRGLGDAARMQGRYAEASAAYRQALAVSEEIGVRWGQAQARRGLGDVALVQARCTEAADAYRQALALSEAIGDRLGQAQARRGLGEIALQQGSYGLAGERLGEAFSLYAEIGLTSHALGWCLQAGRAALDRWTTHRTQQEPQLARQALALALDLAQWADRLVAALPESDRQGGLSMALMAFRAQLASATDAETGKDGP